LDNALVLPLWVITLLAWKADMHFEAVLMAVLTVAVLGVKIVGWLS
jgi:hypothetical protein